MPELCLNLLTRASVPARCDPLALIWDLDTWRKSLNRVLDIRVFTTSATYQHFSMIFEADRDTPDVVEVEREFTDGKIIVRHLVPPPGFISLQADWWVDASVPGVLFAHRKIVLNEHDYAPAMARKMFSLLRENMANLIGSL